MTSRDKLDQRYDRQLRLWGDHGQAAVENAKICLLNSCAVGAELLKNLVLPGIGSFTIIDDALVREEDLGSNFFVSPVDLKKSRAKCVTEHLLELNGAVRGNYLVENYADILENDPDFFLDFHLVINTDARERPLVRLSRLLRSANIPLISCFTLGIVGYLHLSVCEHVIIESHPDATRPDLRLDRPPRDLVEMANECSFESMSSTQLAHTPWLLIVYHFVQCFIKQHGHFPRNHKEKTEVRKMISAGANKLINGLRSREPDLEASFTLDNFEEATHAVNTAVCPTEIPSEVRALLDDDRCSEALIVSESLDGVPSVLSTQHPRHRSDNRQNSDPCISHDLPVPSTTRFWRLVCALKDFIQNEGNGQLPVRGSLPDMVSDSQRYLRLLSIYREESEWAVQRLATRLTQFPDISMQEIRLFVKNAAFLRVVRTRSLEEELKLSPARSEDLTLVPTHEDNDGLLWYLVLRGASSFLSEQGRWPGSASPYTVSCNSEQRDLKQVGDDSRAESPGKHNDLDLAEADFPLLLTHIDRVLRSFGISSNRMSLDYVNEACRFGGGEIHSVAAFMGGIGAQEAIKLLTHQFVPISKPLIYNGITQQTALVEI